MTIVGLYARVSRDAQEKEQTVQSQLEALRAHVQANGYQLAWELTDEGYTGASLARPDLDRLRSGGPGGSGRYHPPDQGHHPAR